jgi:hypothetical protein
MKATATGTAGTGQRQACLDAWGDSIHDTRPDGQQRALHEVAAALPAPGAAARRAAGSHASSRASPASLSARRARKSNSKAKLIAAGLESLADAEKLLGQTRRNLRTAPTIMRADTWA